MTLHLCDTMTSRAKGDAPFRVIEIISNGKSDTLPHSPTASRVYGVGIGRMVRNAGRAGGRAGRRHGHGATGKWCVVWGG